MSPVIRREPFQSGDIGQDRVRISCEQIVEFGERLADRMDRFMAVKALIHQTVHRSTHEHSVGKRDLELGHHVQGRVRLHIWRSDTRVAMIVLYKIEVLLPV